MLGAYLLMFPRARVLTLVPLLFIPLFFQVPAVLFLLIWFGTQLIQATMGGLGADQVAGVAWWAHIGGFLIGMALIFVFKKREQREFYWE